MHAGIRAVLAESGVAPEQIGALSTTGMVPAVLPVDGAGTPVRRAMLQNDARATAEIAELKNVVDEDAVLRATGSAVTQQSVGPTALWLQRNEPETWRATTYLVGSYDWVLMALGAPPHVELNWAIESGLGTVDGQRFEPMYAAAGLAAELVPTVLSPVPRQATSAPPPQPPPDCRSAYH